MKKRLLLIVFALLMSLSLTACKGERIKWSDIILESVLPKPDSSRGKLYQNSEEELDLCLYNITSGNYNDYVSECKDKGFTIEPKDVHGNYSSYNSDGYKLDLTFDKKGKEMSIKLKAPMEMPDIEVTETTAATETPTTEMPTTEITTETAAPTEIITSDTVIDISGEVNPEFKASLDTYEAFFDEYVAFMKKYKNADQSDLMNMLNDYNNYLQKYTEAVNALNSVDSSSLSPADYAYYTEVMTRISQKLLAVSQ